MPIEFRPLQYAHSDGHTDVSYSSDGEKIISCGADGDVRIWEGYEDDDPMNTCLGEFVLCARCKNNNVLVGTDNNNVQLLSFPSGERDGILTRFTSHVNHIAIGKNHTYIALGSEDMNIKVIDLSSKETKMSVNVDGTPLSLAICPIGKNLAVACGDGKLLIYDIEDESTLKVFSVVPKTNSFLNAKLLCRVDFEQNHNKYFAYPESNKIVILKISDWSELFTLSTDFVDAPFSIVSFSTCGNYIAGASLEGDIVVFSVLTQCMVGYKKHPKGVAVTALAWNPKENGELAFGDAQGYLGLAVNCSINEAANESPKVSTSKPETKEVDMETEASEIDFGDIQIEDDDDDNENAISLKKLKAEVMGNDEETNEDKVSTRSPTPDLRPRTPEIPLQSPFMPSSTPEHLDPRYLCWNEVGVIRCYGASLDEDDDGARSIEVEFHDSTLHNSMMINNYQGYFMGSVSTAALAVANNNTVKIIPLKAANKEWQFNVPEPEEISLIAVSHNLVCCATTNYLLHVFSTFGTQRAVVAIPGPVISMSAFGHVVIIAYHIGAVRKSDQCVNIMLLKFEGHSVENRTIYAALGLEAKLQWLGFSDVGTPALMDSNGMIFFHPLQSNVWLPFCDTTRERKSPMDGFFLTAIFESFCTARGIKCKGSIYPGFTPRPTLCEIELQAPYLELSTEKAQLEANLFTWSNLQVKDFDKKYKEVALKTFALAAKNNLDQRALEFVELEMLEFKQILDLAVKYASKLNKNRLVEKLLEISSKAENNDDFEDSINDTTISTPTNVIKPNRTLVLSSSKYRTKGQTPSSSSLTPSSSDFKMSQSSDNTPTSSKNMSTVSTQESSILEKEHKNPFLKKLKKPEAKGFNPLSLTEKFEVSENKDKENKIEQMSAEKRKKPDSSPIEKKNDKQRRLDKFMFKKTS